jgi:hypothetical protein
MSLIQVGSITESGDTLSTLANVPHSFLSFVMIMEASSELLHHESSAKGASPNA